MKTEMEVRSQVFYILGRISGNMKMGRYYEVEKQLTELEKMLNGVKLIPFDVADEEFDERMEEISGISLSTELNPNN